MILLEAAAGQFPWQGLETFAATTYGTIYNNPLAAGLFVAFGFLYVMARWGLPGVLSMFIMTGVILVSALYGGWFGTIIITLTLTYGFWILINEFTRETKNS